MSDIITPRTDAARFNLVCHFDQGGIYDADPKRANDGEWVPVDVCAQLETELQAMTALADQMAAALRESRNTHLDTIERCPTVVREAITAYEAHKQNTP